MRKLALVLLLVTTGLTRSYAQRSTNLSADAWVDSVFRTLTPDQKITQLMVIRLSGIDPVTQRTVFYDSIAAEAVGKYNVGGICTFQGDPVAQAERINRLQGMAKTPILFCIDAENGLGMRMDSVEALPRQMMLGATSDTGLIYRYGRLVGTQLKRIGIQVNYAPVVDINNNPDNPVINDRSFGEDKQKVAEFGIQYMRGMQDVGVMACAKHFPGHGDVAVDSHLDLPVISKSRRQLDSLELYPFRQLFKAGVGSVMIAHLYIPAIDKTPNRATSLSYENVTRLLRKQLHYQGISFTDALEMKGVTKYFPNGDAAVQSLIAGNDMLCLPGDVALSLEKIKIAIREKQLKWKDIDVRVKRVLAAKYAYGLAEWRPVILVHLTADLNSGITGMRREVAKNAVTLLQNQDSAIFPLLPSPVGPDAITALHPVKKKRIAYVGMGLTAENAFSQRMREDYAADVYLFDYNLDGAKAAAALELLGHRYDAIVIGLHNYARYPARNFLISDPAAWLLGKLQERERCVTLVFGNPYAIRNTCLSKVLVACYEDDPITQQVAADLLNGKFTAKGHLPVTVCPEYRVGAGIMGPYRALPAADPLTLGMDTAQLSKIDAICEEAIEKGAAPGCVVLVAKDGKIAYEKAFGYMTYDKKEPVYTETLYDMASCTKICATTMAAMKLYDEGRLDLHKTLGDYLPWVRGSDKANLTIWDILLHQAGLVPDVVFYKEVVDSSKDENPMPGIFTAQPDSIHTVRVAQNLYLRNDWRDTMNLRIAQSLLGPRKYVYSDNDFILMGEIVEAITGMTLDAYVRKTFYDPLGMASTGFLPRERFPVSRIAPTALEPIFRHQLLRGDVHDPGSAMFGGVAGHAGLFSDAYDLAILEQMLLDGGTFNGRTYLRKSTIDTFTAYHSDISRRALGFDKPEKNNAELACPCQMAAGNDGGRPCPCGAAPGRQPYPCLSASPETFGHTGFTGTCVWVDPKYDLTFIFLSNRVNPVENNPRLSGLNIRGRIQETVYQAMGIDAGATTKAPAAPVKKRKKRHKRRGLA